MLTGSTANTAVVAQAVRRSNTRRQSSQLTSRAKTPLTRATLRSVTTDAGAIRWRKDDRAEEEWIDQIARRRAQRRPVARQRRLGLDAVPSLVAIESRHVIEPEPAQNGRGRQQAEHAEERADAQESVLLQHHGTIRRAAGDDYASAYRSPRSVRSTSVAD